MGFSHMPVFMAGEKSTGAFVAMMVVVSISSQMPPATFPMTLAVQGATRKRSPRLASETCFTSKLKLRSKVSTMHLLLVSVSNVIGVMKWVAFWVMMTWTSAFNFTSIEARLAIL